MSHRGGFYADETLSSSNLDTDFDSVVEDAVAKRRLVVTVDPSGPSTRYLVSRSDEVSFVGAENVLAGGEVRAHDSIVNISGLGVVASAVSDSANFTFGPAAKVTEAAGYRVDVASIASGAAIDTLYGFSFEDLSTTPNITGVAKRVAFGNKDPGANIENAGSYIDSTGRTLGAVDHPGVVAGRFYTSEFESLQAVTTTLNTLYFNPVYVPHKCNLKTLSVTLSTTVAATSAKLALWNIVEGRIVGKVAEGTVAMATAGNYSVTFATGSVQLTAGVYALGVSTLASVDLNGAVGRAGDTKQGHGAIPTVVDVGVNSHVLTPMVTAYASPLPELDQALLYSSNVATPLVWLEVE